MLSPNAASPGPATTNRRYHGSNRNKLALRRQSIRTLTDSELRIVNGGGTGAAPAPGTDRQTIGTSGTSVIRQSGTSIIIPVGWVGDVLGYVGDQPVGRPRARPVGRLASIAFTPPPMADVMGGGRCSAPTGCLPRDSSHDDRVLSARHEFADDRRAGDLAGDQQPARGLRIGQQQRDAPP